MPFISLSIAVLIGICLYAGLHFLAHYNYSVKRHAPNVLYLYFGLLCVAAIGYSLAELRAYYTLDPHTYVTAFRWRAIFAGIFLSIWPWFVLRYTGFGPRWFVWVTSLLFASHIVRSLLGPFGSFFDSLPVIDVREFPWGERISFHQNVTFTIGDRIIWVVLLLIIGYTFYACFKQYQRGQHKRALMLASAMLVFTIFLAENLFVRTGLIDFIFLAQYGLPAIIIIMSCALHQQAHEHKQRAFALLDHVPAVIYMKDTQGRYLLVNKQFEELHNKSNAEMLGKSDFDVLDADTARAVRQNDADMAAAGHMVEFRESIEHPDHSIHTYNSLKFPLYDSNNNMYAVCGVSTDVTQLQLANELYDQSESKYRTLYETASDAIFLMQDNVFTDCNTKTLEMFGCRREDIVGNTPMAFSPATQYDGSSSVDKAIEKITLAFRGEPQTFDWLHSRLDGSLFDAEVSLNYLELDSQPSLLAIVRDVTARKRSEDALRNIATGVTGQSGEAFYHQVVTHLVDLFQAKFAFIGILDKDNPHHVQTLAVCIDGKIADNMRYRLNDSPCENVLIRHTCSYPVNVQSQFPDDRLLKEMGAESYIGTPLHDANQQSIGLIVVIDSKPMSDIAQLTPILEIFAARTSAEIERVAAETHIRRMAFEDYLTGLANRAALHEHMAGILKRSRNRTLSGAMLLIDLDHFKTINDALSHDVGDQVLKLVGQRLQDIADNSIYLARIGGDEFVALLTTDESATDIAIEDYATKFALLIVDELTKPLHLDNRILNIGASVGVVFFPQQGDNELDIMRRADMALYRAKNMGRGNVQFYEPALQEIADERLHIERGLRHAIENNELSLHYQPQVNIEGKFIGAEALLRWFNPELGQVAPDRFIPVAEETGLIHEVGDWVLNEACRQIQVWQQAGSFAQHIAVNVSAWQFANPDFVPQVNAKLAKYNLKPQQLVLELTESALLFDLQEAISKLANFRKTGIRVALDDFGTGYSSLAYLKDMAMDILKIDKAFTHELTKNNQHPLVETIIAMGQHMNLEVIAEGVETAAQRNILIDLGCESFQGYYFAKPMSAADFSNWQNQNSGVVTLKTSR